MKVFIFSLTIFALSMLGLAVGYIIKGKKLKGSCGGLNNLGPDNAGECSICGAKTEDQCENPNKP